MNESREQVIESLVKEILEKSKEDEYSYDDWSLSKKKISELCELSTPNNIRYAVWKHLVQQGDQEFENDKLTSSTNNSNSLSSSTSKTNINLEMLKNDCLQISQDYNLLSQIKSFNNNSSTYSFDSFKSINSGNSIMDQVTPETSEANSPLTMSFDKSQSILTLSTLSTDSISERLSRFVIYFCNKTTRGYSIDVVKLMVPFVVLSIVEEINFYKNSKSVLHQNPTEQNWMSLSIKLIETLSNSGIFHYDIANPILLCESEMFRILLLYHDPVLSHFLNQRTVSSMHYFYEWINHMFCGCIDIKFLVQIWDLFLYHNNQDFYIYFAAALIISKREQVLSIQGTAKDIMHLLEEKNIVNSLSNQLKLPGLVRKAESLRSSTPLSFIRNWNKFYTYCKDPSSPKLESIAQIYREYKYAVCMGIDVEELILNSKFGKELSNAQDIFSYYCQDDQLQEYRLFIFDSRPYKYYKSGKFPESFHLPPGLLVTQPEEFQRVIQSFVDMKGVTHFAFYDNWQQFQNPNSINDDADTNDNGDVNMNILKFLKEGFPYISKVPTGYKKIHDIFLSKGLELSVHFSDKCPVCNPAAFNNTLPVSEPSSPLPSTEQTQRDKWFSKLRSFGRQSQTMQPLTSQPPQQQQSPEGDSFKKTALGFFREKLKIRDRSSIYENDPNAINNSNNSGNQVLTPKSNNNQRIRSDNLTIGSNRTPSKNALNQSVTNQLTPSSINTNIGLMNSPLNISGLNSEFSSVLSPIPKYQSKTPHDFVSANISTLDNNNGNNNNNIINSNNNLAESNNIKANNGSNQLRTSQQSLDSSNRNPLSQSKNSWTSSSPLTSSNSNSNNLSSQQSLVSNNNSDISGTSPLTQSKTSWTSSSPLTSSNNNLSSPLTTSQTNLLASIWSTTKNQFYLPNLAPFIMDFDEDEYYEEGKKYYYYLDENEFPSSSEPDYLIDKEKYEKENMEANKELEKYRGIEDWLEEVGSFFECQEQSIQSNNTSSIIEESNTSEAASAQTTNETLSSFSSSSSSSLINIEDKKRYIVIKDNVIIVLKEHPTLIGYVKVDFQYSLNSIQRISYKKNTPNLLEFCFDGDDNNSGSIKTIENDDTSLTTTSNSSTQKDIFKKSYIFEDSKLILKVINNH